MNLQQVLSLARTALKVIGTALTTYGTVSTGMWESISGLVILIIPIVWDMFVHTESNAVAIVAALPGTDTNKQTGTITMVDPSLKQAAKAAATPAAI